MAIEEDGIGDAWGFDQFPYCHRSLRYCSISLFSLLESLPKRLAQYKSGSCLSLTSFTKSPDVSTAVAAMNPVMKVGSAYG